MMNKENNDPLNVVSSKREIHRSITTSHLLELHARNLITGIEFDSFIRNEKRELYIDAKVLTDLRYIVQGGAMMNSCGIYSVDTDKAREFALKLHDRQLITQDELREYFGFEKLEGKKVQSNKNRL